MFLLEIMIEDKNLGKALIALNGLAHSMKPPRPMNVDVKGKTLISKGGSLTEIITTFIAKHKLKEITRAEMARLAVEAGKSPTSANNVTATLIEAKRLKRVSVGHYKVI